MSIKIALFGGMRTGKDTLALALREAYPLMPVDFFATPLYQAHAALLPGIEKNRAFLQDISSYFTQQYDGHFVVCLANRHPKLQEEGLLISDGRRAIEYAWCRAHGFILVKMTAPEQVRIQRGAEPDRINHPVETALDILPNAGWDLILDSSLYTVEEELRLVEKEIQEWGMASPRVLFFQPALDVKRKKESSTHQVELTPADRLLQAMAESIIEVREEQAELARIAALQEPYWLADIPPSEEEIESLEV